MNKNFVKICKMSQRGLKKYVKNRLSNTHKDITVGDGFVYAAGTFPVLLVAHLDTVHDLLPTTVYYDAVKEAFYCDEGIGGDDRCGVYMIFEVLKRFNCSVLFCEDEEIGMVGATKFTQTDLAKKLAEDSAFNYIIEFDRKGSNDAVFYDCDNDEFEKFITKEFYKSSWGSFSDISVLAPFLKCAAVNLSCGYYNAHTKKEYVIIPEMEASIEAACKILERTTEDDKFEYIEREYTGYYRGWGDGLYCGNYSGYGGSKSGWWQTVMGGEDSMYQDDDDDSELYDLKYTGSNYYYIEYCNEAGKICYESLYANSKYEALGKFLYLNPDLSYDDIVEIATDTSMSMPFDK